MHCVCSCFFVDGKHGRHHACCYALCLLCVKISFGDRSASTSVFKCFLEAERYEGFLGGTSGREPAYQCRRHKRWDLIPGLERSPGGGHGNPPQYSCLENPMDRGAWWATVHGVTKSWTQLKPLNTGAARVLFKLQCLTVCIFC